MSTPTTSREKRAARQRRYYEAHREVLKEKARARYDPERKSVYYLENRDDILDIARLRYVAKRAERIKAELEHMASAFPHHAALIKDIIQSGRFHAMKPKDLRVLRTTVLVAPPPQTAPAPPPVVPTPKRLLDIPELIVTDFAVDDDGPDVVELLRMADPARKPPQNEIIYPV